MSAVIKALEHWAYRRPSSPALLGDNICLSYFELSILVEQTARELQAFGIRTLGILCDNSPAWAIVDLATQKAQGTCVPIPPFFSERQINHAVHDAGIELILTDNPARLQGCGISVPNTRMACGFNLRVTHNTPCTWLRLSGNDHHDHPMFAKITYTSGTTDEPKGVCLTQQAIDTVAESLAQSVALHTASRHLAVMPLATLLENIGGLYAPLIAGAATHLLSMQQLGASGPTGWDMAQLIRTLQQTQVHTLILVPQLLQHLVEYMETSGAALPDLQFIAVGGAPVSTTLLQRAAQVHLPVYEGYGLSECSSVVAVNTPGQHRPGSAGKPLAHVRLDFAQDGEIHVRGATFSGYLHDSPGDTTECVSTGDCGYLDDDGYLYLTGRKKHMFITGYGRNVAPEWVERELVLQPSILQAAVFGEARPYNIALIVPGPDSDAQQISNAIASVNHTLPDYARITRWLCAEEPFSISNHELTATGRLRRNIILSRYREAIDHLYQDSQRKFA